MSSNQLNTVQRLRGTNKTEQIHFLFDFMIRPE